MGRDQKQARMKMAKEQQKMTQEAMATATIHPCPDCGSLIYVQVYIMKRISPIYTPDGKARFIPVTTFRCMKCGSEVKDPEPKKEKEKFTEDESLVITGQGSNNVPKKEGKTENGELHPKAGEQQN